MRQMNLEPIIHSEVNHKEKDKYCILMHVYRIYKNRLQAIKEMAIRTYISIITLNATELNAPTKRHRLAEWIQKQDPYNMLSTRNPLQT